MNQIELKPINSIKKCSKNPRKIDSVKFDNLVKSIKEFPEMLNLRCIVVDENMEIIGGNQRYDACLAAGLKEIPVIRAESLTESQKKEFMLKDNVHAGEFDFDLVLDFNLDDDVLGDWGVDLDFKVDISDNGGGQEEEFIEPEFVVSDRTVRDVFTSPGDVWSLGDHRLMCGDSTKLDDVSLLMNGSLADAWVTDPPYNVDYDGASKNKRDGIKNDNMSDNSFRSFLNASYNAADKNMRVGAVFYIWHASSEVINFAGSVYDVGWNLHQTLIWVKSQFVLGRSDYHWKHEPCLYGWKKGAAHYWSSDRTQTTILEFDKPNNSPIHPTMKPVPLIQYCVENNTKPGDIVLDSFGGSGTTLIACMKSNRISYSMEFDPYFCDEIINRYVSFCKLNNIDYTVKLNGVEYENSKLTHLTKTACEGNN